MRGAPGNTINDRTSYWVPSHSTPRVRAGGRRRQRRRLRPRRRAGRGGALPRHRASRHEPLPCSTSRRPTTGCACVRVHPGVTVDDVVAATGFELAIDGDVPESRLPDRRRSRPDPRRHRPERAGRAGSPGRDACARRSATRSGSTSRSCRPAWAGSPGARLVTATANAGALGILASATMTYDQLARRGPRGQGAHRPPVRREPARRRRGRRRARRAARSTSGCGSRRSRSRPASTT